MSKQHLWKSQKEGYNDSLRYLKGRMEGVIKSIKTPWDKFNDATTDGLEWHSMTVIGGRPGSGKTLIKDQIVREAFKLNPTESFRVLEFQFEMLAVEEPITVNEFKEAVSDYMKEHMILNESGEYEFTKTIITLDHSLLLKKAPFEKDKFDTLYNLGEAITELKRKYPIAFIILTQLNRGIDNPERNEDGKYGNYILESDIFGSDALLQHADTLIGINRPGKQKIRFYGPDRYIIEDDKVLVLHFLKCRNGDNRMSFFKAQFDRMRITEMPTPAQQEKRQKI